MKISTTAIATLIAMLGASGSVLSADLIHVPVEATVTMSPGETVQQAIQRIQPLLAEAALSAQPGLTARVVLDRDDRLVTRTTQIQAAVTTSTVDDVQMLGNGRAKVQMTFTLDNEAGAQYRQLQAENELLKAKLSDAAESLETDQVGKAAAYEAYRNRVANLEVGTRAAGAVSAGVAAGMAQQLVDQAEGRTSCSGKYQVVAVENTQYQRQDNGDLSASSQIHLRRVFDSCLDQLGRQTNFYLVAWLGSTRLVTAIEQGKPYPMPFGGTAQQRMSLEHGKAYHDGWGLFSDVGGGALKSQISTGDRTIYWDVGGARALADQGAADIMLNFSVRGVPGQAYKDDDRLKYAIVMAW